MIAERVTIEVTQTDIDTGEPRSPFECALALAWQRATGNPRASVGEVGAYIEIDGVEITYEIPDEATTFVIDYDHDEPVFPATFTFTRYERNSE